MPTGNGDINHAIFGTEDGGAIHEYTFKVDKVTIEEPEVRECVPDGINIHITGSHINKISNIEIYFKEGE